MPYDVLPATLDIFGPKTRPARPQISTTPVRRVLVNQNVPQEVGDERAEQLSRRPAQAQAPLPLFGNAKIAAPSVTFGAPLAKTPPSDGARIVTPPRQNTMQRAGGLLTQVPPSAPRDRSMNSGGTITGRRQTRTIAPSPYNPTPAPGGGTMQRAGGPAVAVPPTPVASPTTVGAPQTESNNPLTGAGNQQPGGTTTALPPAQAMGFSQRGMSTPAGQDASGASGAGASGLFSRKFADPRAASIYDGIAKRLFQA